MVRASRLLGLPAFVVGAGRKLGRVRDLLLAEGGGQAAGLLIQVAARARPLVPVAWSSLQVIGPDAVFLAELAAPAPGRNLSAVSGRPVMDGAGAQVGFLSDLWLDPKSGALAGLQVSRGLVDDLFSGQPVLPLRSPLLLGQDLVIWQGGDGPA